MDQHEVELLPFRSNSFRSNSRLTISFPLMLDQDVKIPDFEVNIDNEADKVFCLKKLNGNRSPEVENETKVEVEDRDSNPGLALQDCPRFQDQKAVDVRDLDQIESAPLVEVRRTVTDSIPDEDDPNQVSEPVSILQPATVQTSPANNDQNDLFDVSQTRFDDHTIEKCHFFPIK